MGWSDPSNHVFVVGELVTPATLNTYVKDNLIDLDRRSSFRGNAVETLENTVSTTYADLTTVGPQVSIEVGSGSGSGGGRGGEVLVGLYASLANATAGNASHMSYVISGATARGAADNTSIAFTAPVNQGGARFGASFHVSGLNPGVHTFTAKYRCSGGEGRFDSRRITVVPFGS